jgi:Fic family protein
MLSKVKYKKYRWEPRVGSASYDLWERRRIPQMYEAAVLSPIAEARISIPKEAEELYGSAVEAIVRFDAELGQKQVIMPEILLRSESASSSQIERLSASTRNIALAELGDTSRKNAVVVAGNIKAMKKALDQSGKMTSHTIKVVHRALLENSDPEIAGNYRTEQVWIGGSSVSPHKADFVPPHHENVREYIADWLKFAARQDIHGLLKAAVAHCQFETIHPFLDGNGRTGRALIQIMLHEAGLIRKSALPISAGLLSDTKNYFRALESYRDGDISVIVEQMCHAAIDATLVGSRMVERVEALREKWAAKVSARREAAVWRLMDILLTRSVTDAKHAATELAVTDPAARNAIETLVGAGILKRIDNRMRNVLYEAVEVSALQDAFAKELARRQ